MKTSTNPQREASQRSEQRAAQVRSLDYLREELLQYRPDIYDEDLRTAVTEWLLRAQSAGAVDVEDAVSKRLGDLRSNYPMRREPATKDGSEGFPDACKGCPSYGRACPMIWTNDVVKHRERIFDEADEPAELRRRLRDLAIDNGCVALIDTLEDIETDLEPVIAQGETLLMAVEDILLFGSEQTEVYRRALNVDADDEQEELDG